MLNQLMTPTTVSLVLISSQGASLAHPKMSALLAMKLKISLVLQAMGNVLANIYLIFLQILPLTIMSQDVMYKMLVDKSMFLVVKHA